MNAALIPKASSKPPLPLIGMRAIERMLLRHVFAPVPEAKLIVAVICQGIADASAVEDYTRRRAHQFLLGSDLDQLADLVELNPEFVREVARRARYLTTQKTPKPKKRTRKSGAR